MAAHGCFCISCNFLAHALSGMSTQAASGDASHRAQVVISAWRATPRRARVATDELRDLSLARPCSRLSAGVQDSKLCMGFMMPGFNVDDDCPKEGHQGAFLPFHSRLCFAAAGLLGV